MRIMFVCGAGLVSGKERQTLEFMIELRGRGHDVFCATSTWTTGEFEALLEENGIPFSPLRIGFISITPNWSSAKMSLHQAIYIPSLYSNYRKLIRQWNPEVVVHSNFHHVFLLMPLLRSRRHVFHVHDVFANKPMFRRLFRMFSRRMDLFIGVSKFVCRSLEDLGVPAGKIELTYNGVRVPATIARSENEVPVIGIVGQVGSWKGHEVLIKALSNLKDISWRLHIIGSGDEAFVKSLKTSAVQLGIDSRISFKGRINGLENIYRELDIACVPTVIREAFGLSAAEPAFFGIPAVVSDLGGLPEIVVHQKTGLVVPPNNETALGEALRFMITNPAERRQLGEQARLRVNGLFTLTAGVDRMESLLAGVSSR